MEARASVNDVQRKVARVAEAATVAAVSLQASPAFALVRGEKEKKIWRNQGVYICVYTSYVRDAGRWNDGYMYARE